MSIVNLKITFLKKQKQTRHRQFRHSQTRQLDTCNPISLLSQERMNRLDSIKAFSKHYFLFIYLHWRFLRKQDRKGITCFLCVIILGSSTEYKKCAESFLFSLVNPSGTGPTKMPLKGNNNQYGICCYSEYGPTFGGGNDLYIASGANANSNSHCNLGNTYQCPANANSSFLVGQKNFCVNEMEVFVFKAN